MKLNQIIKYHSTLNPHLWDKFELIDEVADKLHEISDEFIEFIGVDSLKVTDIIITGSNANYNWTEKSDIDLHLLVDLEEFKTNCPDLTDDFFNDKKTLWNEQHDIQIYGFDVEVYVQDEKEPHIATGQYSLKHGEWVKEPEYKEPSIDDGAVKAKSQQLMFEIDRVVNDRASDEAVSVLKDKIKTMRQAGLSDSGEFSTENITFKLLRNNGYIDKLYDYHSDIIDNSLSLT